MSPETTLEMMMRWLLEGRKIRHMNWTTREFTCLKNGVTVDEHGVKIDINFGSPKCWELYQEPKEKVKWYQVIAHHKTDSRPFTKTTLFKSEQDYLDNYELSKEGFHWIKLIEIDYE